MENLNTRNALNAIVNDESVDFETRGAALNTLNNIVITAPQNSHAIAVSNVGKAFDAWVKQEGKTGEIITQTASAMCLAYDVIDMDTGARVTPWYELKGKLKGEVSEARKLFAAKFEAIGKSEGWIKVNWQRIKEASGYVTAGNRATGGQTVDALNLQNLKTILNRIFKSEEEGTESAWSDVKGELMEVFEQMGGEIGDLG